MEKRRRPKWAEIIRKLVLFSMLGALMFTSKVVMEALPNVHLVGALVMIYTIVYRFEALVPIAMFVLLSGVYMGFSPWWVPYCYVWTVLWGVTMLLPRRMPKWLKAPIYITICALHGLAFGTLYAPFQALVFGLDWRGMLAWIASGFPFDVVHAIGNLVAGTLIVPISTVLLKLESKFSRKGSVE